MSARAFSANAAVLTVSDGVDSGTREDESGAAITEMLESGGYAVVARRVVPDEHDQIEAALRDLARIANLVITTGGTGFGPRDVTPEATRRVLERDAPGLMFLMLTTGIRSTPLAALSRGVAGSIGQTLIVNLPGSPKGATENLSALVPVLPHAIELLSGATEHRDLPSL